MARVKRRTDDMLIIRGVNLYPSQIEGILLEAEGTLPHYLLVVTRTGAMDDLEVKVEVTPEVFSDKVKALETLRRNIGERIKSLLGCRPRSPWSNRGASSAASARPSVFRTCEQEALTPAPGRACQPGGGDCGGAASSER